MKKIIYLSVLCASFLFAETKDEILQKAMKFEQAKDYENAMLYYKKLAMLDMSKPLDYNDVLTKPDNQNSDKLATDFSYYENDTSAKKVSKSQTFKNVDKNLYPRADSLDKQWIYMYQPTYLGYAYDFDKKDDRKRGETRFQISFQKPLFDDLLGLDETWSVAYTQTSFWQTSMESAPFRANNYEPEIFVTMPTDILGLDYLRVGLNHESNGKSGTESRSWNRAYVQTSFNVGDLRITPRAWHSFTFDRDNRDIRQYLGYGDIKFDYDINDEHRLSALLRNNLRLDNQNRGALELNWYFPLPFKTDLRGFVQYFTGYGESLEDYNHHVDKAMIGVVLIEK